MNYTTLTPEEYLSAVKLGQKLSHQQRKKYLIASIIAFIVGAASLKFGNPTVGGGLIGGVVGGLIGHWILKIYILKFRAQKIYTQQKFLHQPYAYSWCPEGLLIRSDVSSWLTPWSHFLRRRENNEVMILYHSDYMFQILPKTTFTSQESENLLRLYLEPVREA